MNLQECRFCNQGTNLVVMVPQVGGFLSDGPTSTMTLYSNIPMNIPVACSGMGTRYIHAYLAQKQMITIPWKALLAGTATVGTALVVASGEVQAQMSQPQQFAQVNALSDLSDVQPTDWYFQALQSLVERYGCIAGYPDGTYRGQRAMTRGEFAAGLNACLDVINQLIAEGLADKVTQDDLAVVQRLQEEFAAELIALKGRVNALEAKTAELEANPLGLNATTSKLSVQLISGIFAATQTSNSSEDTNNVMVPYRLRMNFDTSLTGKDLFRIRVQSRQAPNFQNNPVKLQFGTTGCPGSPDADVCLDDTYYRFHPFNDRVTAVFGLLSVAPGDTFKFTTPFNALNDFADVPDRTYDDVGGSTLALSWEAIEDRFYLSYGYSANQPDASRNDYGNGFFAGATVHAAEAAFTPNDRLMLAVAGSFQAEGQGSTSSFNKDYSAITAGVDWEIHPRLHFNATYTRTFVEDKSYPDSGDFNDWLVGFVYNDLFIEAGSLGLLVGSPDSRTGMNTNLDAEDRWRNNNTPILAEIYYVIPVTENLSLTPGLYYTSDIDGDSNSSVVGGVRTIFEF